MAWIESHTVLMRHRKVADLARHLRLRRSYVIGHLHALWHAALEQQDDGDLSAWSDEFIAEQSDFPGDAPQWVRLLQETGFLDGKLLHDWPDYAGRFLTARYHSGNPDRLREIWSVHGREYGSPKAVRTKSQLSHKKGGPPNQPNLTNHTQPKKSPRKPPGGALPGFDRFWEAWPSHDRKVDKPKCRAKWDQLKLEPRADEMVAVLERFKASNQWRKDGGAYIPGPMTWLNGGRYETPPPDPSSSPGDGGEGLLPSRIRHVGNGTRAATLQAIAEMKDPSCP